MLIYRVIATFNPNHPKMDGTTTVPGARKHRRQMRRLRRGVWRVLYCIPIEDVPGRPLCNNRIFTQHCPGHGKELWTFSDREAARGTIINPAAALKRALIVRQPRPYAGQVASVTLGGDHGG